jgi:hypothetical protein
VGEILKYQLKSYYLIITSQSLKKVTKKYSLIDLLDWEIRCKKGVVNGWFVVEPPYLPANPSGTQIEDRTIIDKYSAVLRGRTDKPKDQVSAVPRHFP